jgi:transcriptional regulator
MYIPSHFKVTDREKALAFINANAFGQLISMVDGKLFSSHVPFYHDNKKGLLICHIARRNPQWENIEKQEILVTFQGPHDYISPSWYDSPGVPTWNYQAVHVYGRAKVITEEGRLKNIVSKLTEIYESAFEDPWSLEYKESMLNVIIGIEIKITEIQCKYKLSQNRSERDRRLVIDQLKERGSVKLSDAMKIEL